ncbi:lipoprotein [Streptomyces mesophilus]|uniref:lipoprotein n=1 Tax=Streptomyces mesophilus TaxID=1775132 RepID=UPI003331FA2E
MRSAVIRGVLAAAVMAGLVAGCSGGGDGKTSGASGSKAPGAGKSDGSGKSDDSKNGDADTGGAKGNPPAKSGGSVGAAGSACKLPVTFGIAAKWEPTTVDIDPDSNDLADLLRQGPVVIRCEVNGKKADSIAFIRAHLEESPAGGSPRKVLEGYVAADEDPKGATYTTFAAGGETATEVVYTTTSKLLEEERKARAFAVGTPDGVVLVSLGGFDSEEPEVLSAYELAKQTLKVN